MGNSSSCTVANTTTRFGIIAIDAKTPDSRETETRFFLAEEGAVSRFRNADGGRVGQMKNEE